MTKETVRELMYLVSKRENVGEATEEEEILGCMEEKYPPIVQFIDKLKTSREDTLSRLSDTKNSLDGERHSPTKPLLCAAAVEDLSRYYRRFSTDCLSKGDKPSFRFYYDISSGIQAITTVIFNSQDYIAGEYDRHVQRRMSMTFNETDRLGVPISIGQQTEMYLNLINSVKNWAELLMKDPTGFLLVDSAVVWVEEGRKRLVTDNQAKEYVVSGAKLGRDAYKLFYEIAGDLYPSSPQQSPQ